MPPNRNWIYGAIAALIIVTIIAVARPRQHSQSAAAPAAKTSWPTRTVSPQAKPQHPTKNLESVPRPQDPVASKTVWRVVLYTYDQKQDAQASAQRINQQHPGLHVQAFQPNGGSRYLVVTDGQPDRDAAVQLRKQALRIGLPKDVYIQNFRH